MRYRIKSNNKRKATENFIKRCKDLIIFIRKNIVIYLLLPAILLLRKNKNENYSYFLLVILPPKLYTCIFTGKKSVHDPTLFPAMFLWRRYQFLQ